MEIAIPIDAVKALGVRKFAKFKVEADALNWKKKVEVDLNDYEIVEVKELEALLSSQKDVRGVKTALYEISVWYMSHEQASSVVVKKLEHFESLLYRYVQKLPQHWLFKRHGKFLDAWLPYYISRVEYFPADTSRDGYRPAYVKVEGVYEQFGRRDNETFMFYDSDVRGKRIAQILLKYDLFAATDELLGMHTKDVGRYSDLVAKIGQQFIVEGSATDDTPENARRCGTVFTFADERRKNRVVIDSFYDVDNKEEDDRRRDVYYDSYYWQRNKPKVDDDEEEDILDDATQIEIPIHPFLVIFDLFRHLRLSVHAKYLQEYVYDEKLADKLILSDDIKSLVTMLVEYKDGSFKDIVAGKGGGAIILLTGKPGVGKTLTAEVFAEADKKPLYSVQASQLGTNPEELETNLLLVLQRASRWGAIMLLDEADVYVHTRGNDLTQNAIVGVFLRVLEYHSSVLFLTSNRPDLVDDAIASRCVARIDYEYPSVENQKRIWAVLCEASGVKVSEKEYGKFVERHQSVCGRDVKNLLKLVGLLNRAKESEITCELLEYALKFKPV